MQLRKVCFATVLLVAVLAVAVSGQELAGKFAVSPQVGAVIPIGDFSDTDTLSTSSGGATASYSFGGSVEYFFTENIAVGGNFMYDHFGFDEAALGDLPTGAVVDGDWTILQFGAFVKYVCRAGKATRGFGRAGVLFGKADLKGDVTMGSVVMNGDADIAMSMGLEGAVGVLHMVSENMGIFGEVSFVHLMTDGKDMELVDPLGTRYTEEADGDTQWFGVRVGASIFFGGK